MSEKLPPAPNVALEDVVWRIDGKPNNGRARFVPFIDSRIAAHLLDMWVGAANWRDVYETGVVKGQECLWCHLEVRDPATGEWVRKSDVGVPTGIEAQKGAVSDAFKRAACLKWGAGRNVYDLPGDLWAPVKMVGEKAYANDQSVPELLRQLKARGFNADTTGAETEGTTRSDTDLTPDQAVTITDAQTTQIVAVFDQLPTKDLRAAAKKEFVRLHGRPDSILAERYREAYAGAVTITDAHQPDPVEPAPAAVSPGEEPPPAPVASPAPPVAQPGSGGGHSVDAVKKMTAAEITPVLEAEGLALTGSIAAKRQRLLEHYGKAPEAPANVETGKVLFPVEEYLAGITQYEDQLDDPTQWFAWLSDTFSDRTMDELSQVELSQAWERLKKMTEEASA